MNTDKLKGVIRWKGKTQDDVAKAIGMSLSNFNAIINGKAGEFRLPHIRAMKDYLQLTDQEINDIFLS